MLDTRDIIILTAAFYLGDVVSKFFTALNVDIVAPLLAPAAAAGKVTLIAPPLIFWPERATVTTPVP